MRRWLAIGGAALVTICCLLYFRDVYDLLIDRRVSFTSFGNVFPSAISAYMLAYLAAAMGWHMLVMIVEDAPRTMQSLGIFTASQFAKYLPGNVGHHVGRVFLSVRSGYSSYRVIATMVVELVAVVFAMFLLSLPVLGEWIGRFSLGTRVAQVAAIMAGAAVACGIALNLAGSNSGNKFVVAMRDSFRYAWSRKLPTGFLSLAALLLISLQIILAALSLGLLDPSGTLLSIEHFPRLIAVFSGAWLLGLLVPGAPAGIGIREMVLSEGLAPVIGHEAAVLLALYFRILSVAADLLAFLAGVSILSILRRRNRNASAGGR